MTYISCLCEHINMGIIIKKVFKQTKNTISVSHIK